MIPGFRIAAFALLLLCAAGPARADEVDDLLQAQMRQLHIPGLAMAVVREGRIVKARGYGLAHLELQAPVTPDTVFEIGSLTKQLTAAAVLMLAEEGKVGLDDRIAKYLTGVPAGWNAVTLRQCDRPRQLRLRLVRGYLPRQAGDRARRRHAGFFLADLPLRGGRVDRDSADQPRRRVIDHLAVDVAGCYVPALARPEAAGAEPDAATSRRLRQALLDLVAGKPDPALFTPAMQVFLRTATGKGIWPWAADDGELRSFAFSEQEAAGEDRILRYKAVLGEATRWFSFTLTPEGRIAQVNWW